MAGVIPFALGAASHEATSQLAIFTSPIVRGLQYFANESRPNLLPSPEDCISLYNANKCTYDELSDMLAFHGINVSNPWWAAKIVLSQQQAPLEQIIYDWRRGRRETNSDFVQKALEKVGFRSQAHRDAFLYPQKHISAEDARRLYASGAISDPAEYSRLLVADGILHNDDKKYFDSLVEAPGLPEIIFLLRRGIISHEKATAYLALRGVTDPVIAREILYVAYELPHHNELLAMADKRVWDEATMQRFGMDDGFSDFPIVRFFMEAQGFKKFPGGFPGQPSGNDDWPLLQWRALRQLPDYHRVKEMQVLLRGQGAGGATGSRANVAKWTVDDSKEMLRLGNVPDKLVEQMQATFYDSIGIRHIRMVMEECFRHPELAEQLFPGAGNREEWVKRLMLDLGVDDWGANVLTQVNIKHVDKVIDHDKELTRKHLRTTNRTQVLEMYKMGAITDAEARARITGKEVDAQSANDFVLQADQERAVEIMKTQIEHIHKAYHEGRLDWTATQNALAGIGVLQWRIDQYFTLWSWERTEDRMMLSTAQVLSLLKDGMISEQVALYRLLLIGWDNADALIQIQRIEHDIAQSKVAANIKAVSAATKAANAATKAQRAAAEKQRKEAIRTRTKTIANTYDTLISQNKYLAQFAKEHAAYAKANDKSDQNKMDAARAQIVADWLAMQKKLTVIAATLPPQAATTVPLQAAAVKATEGIKNA